MNNQELLKNYELALISVKAGLTALQKDKTYLIDEFNKIGKSGATIAIEYYDLLEAQDTSIKKLEIALSKLISAQK